MSYELTPQETIRELSRIVPYTAGVSDVDRRDRAIAAAKDALKKQIPTKPEPENRIYGKGMCPRCKAVLRDKSTNYCGNCGQALDWN